MSLPTEPHPFCPAFVASAAASRAFVVATPAFSAADSALRREASSLLRASSDARAFVSERSAAVAAFCAAVLKKLPLSRCYLHSSLMFSPRSWTMPLLFLISLLPLRSEAASALRATSSTITSKRRNASGMTSSSVMAPRKSFSVPGLEPS